MVIIENTLYFAIFITGIYNFAVSSEQIFILHIYTITSISIVSVSPDSNIESSRKIPHRNTYNKNLNNFQILDFQFKPEGLVLVKIL